ncbi:acetyl ornithine aminotransferase family protein [candidate division KSB1 bacterium]|nr:acetyl ornithine aminotransferase family protein [candidate division KSB1 bacterium]RQW09443.1 MAG: acetyl ornithine aminotransferase family protein [candidate division KSB1 bacterium]
MSLQDYPLIPIQPDAPKIKTRLPGPRVKALTARDRRVTSPSYTRDYPLVVDRAIGSVITDPDGNVFLDMTAGIAVTASGHSHPYVVDAIRRQSERCLHMSGTDFYYASQIELAERLVKSAPMKGKNRIFFTNSGAESIEAALKLSRYHTGRQHVIAFIGAFHGRTYGAMSLGASKVIQSQGFKPLVPQISHVDYPNPYRPVGHEKNVTDHTMREIETVFKHKVSPDEVAAIFVEAIQGEGGYIVPPDDFLPRLRELCTKHGIMLVCDEVQSGMGRTGLMWGIQHSGVEPDMIASAKGIASGLPLGALIARQKIMDWPYGAHASTFGGNPVSCAASLATLDLLEAGLMHNAATVGDFLIKRLHELSNEFDVIGDVRGRGLMAAIEFVQDQSSRHAFAEFRNQVVLDCFHRGLLVLGCGESAIRFCPALTVSERQIETAITIVHDAIKAVQQHRRKGEAA